MKTKQNFHLEQHAISLSQQLEYFKEYQSKLVQLVGRRKANDIIQGALYIVGTGTGDFVQNYYINSDLRKLYSVDAFSELLVEESSKFLKVCNSCVNCIFLLRQFILVCSSVKKRIPCSYRNTNHHGKLLGTVHFV